ncbi:histone H2A-like [Battus philenor]|uniref:histone H2A-like n=1 Tax=Battus philenor TaxID=42288 RepID=UPI0035CEAF19
MPSNNLKKVLVKRVKSQSKSKRAGLTFPVGRVHSILRKGNYAKRIGGGCAVYLTAALEFLAAEILELASKAASDNGKNRISPRHILLAIKNDEEIDKMLQGITISQGGVLPCIHQLLLPKKKTKVNNTNVSSQEY